MQTLADAARDAVPIVVGYVTLGLAAGMLLVAEGLAWWWAPVWSLVIYSGTMQMLLVPLAGAGEPLAAIALSTGFVSGRHVFYGLGFPLERVRGRALTRLYAVHAITDEVYALLAARDRRAMSGRYLVGVEAISHASWLSGTTVGALAGTALASVVGERIELLGFVLTSLFVVLAIENWRNHPDIGVLCVGLVAGGVGLAIGGSAALLTALVISREWERGTMEALLSTAVTRGELLLGKLVPYFLLGMLSLTLSVAAIILVFHVPFRGSFLLLGASGAVFLFSALGLGLFISTVAKNQFVACQIAFLAAFMPSLMLSGFIFEISSMPAWIQYICNIIPAKYFITCLHSLFLVGNVPALLIPNMAYMAAVGALLLGLTFLLTRPNLE